MKGLISFWWALQSRRDGEKARIQLGRQVSGAAKICDAKKQGGSLSLTPHPGGNVKGEIGQLQINI